MLAKLLKLVHWPPIIYVLLFSIFICCIGIMQRIDIVRLDTFFLLAHLPVLILGVLHAVYMYRFFRNVDGDTFFTGLWITAVIMLTGAVLTAVLYYFIHLNYYFILFVLPFPIPYLFRCAYRFLVKIPRRVYRLWYYPVGQQMPDLDFIDLSRIQVVQFVFHKNVKDKSEINFTSKAPVDMELGKLFFLFINDYNERHEQSNIDYLDFQSKPYGWLFFRKKKWFGKKRYLDPGKTFRENNIRPNEFIYATRLDNANDTFFLMPVGKAI